MSGEPENIAISAEDQSSINKFSRLILLSKTLRETKTQVSDRVQQCKDALEEVEMCMDPDGMMLLVGEALAVAGEDEVSAQINHRLVGENPDIKFTPNFLFLRLIYNRFLFF
jgi:chaperonin cofactor prefoldin